MKIQFYAKKYGRNICSCCHDPRDQDNVGSCSERATHGWTVPWIDISSLLSMWCNFRGKDTDKYRNLANTLMACPVTSNLCSNTCTPPFPSPPRSPQYNRWAPAPGPIPGSTVHSQHSFQTVLRCPPSPRVRPVNAYTVRQCIQSAGDIHDS